MAEACGGPFADSYLSGATEVHGQLTPKTRIAWERIIKRGSAMEVLKRLRIALVRPPVFGLSEGPLDYDHMTIAEKVRHHLTLANEAHFNAGPMWRGGMNGGPLTEEQMPIAWHEHKARARFHLDEIKRLLGAKAEKRELQADRKLPESEPPAVASLPSIHGPTDDKGVTPQMRAILARQRGEEAAHGPAI